MVYHKTLNPLAWVFPGEQRWCSGDRSRYFVWWGTVPGISRPLEYQNSSYECLVCGLPVSHACLGHINIIITDKSVWSVYCSPLALQETLQRKNYRSAKMHLCRIVVLMIAVLTQLLQCSTAHQTRPSLPASPPVQWVSCSYYIIIAASMTAAFCPHCRGGPQPQARMLMVLQNHKALKCVNKEHEIVHQTPDHPWTLWNLL